MNIRIKALSLVLTIATLNCWAAVPNNHILHEDHRVNEAGRDVLISVGQDEIKANLDRSNIVFRREDQMFIGVPGAAGLANARLRRSATEQQMVAPLQEALSGFEFDALVEQQTTSTLSAVDWLSPLKFTFTKKTSPTFKSATLGSVDSDEMIIVDYEYGMSDHFKAVELNCRVSIAERNKGKSLEPAVRMSPSNMLYTQLHKVVVPLDHASSNANENLDRWSSEQAIRAKKALEISVTMVQQMIRRGLTLTQRDQHRIESERRVGDDQYQGRLIEHSDGNTLLWIAEPYDMWVMISRPVQ